MEYLDDVAADFQAIYHLSLDGLSGPRFFGLALRLFAYQGVMRARMEKEQHDRDDEPDYAPKSSSSAGAQVISLDELRVKVPGVAGHVKV